jgi:hypothetical protein
MDVGLKKYNTIVTSLTVIDFIKDRSDIFLYAFRNRKKKVYFDFYQESLSDMLKRISFSLREERMGRNRARKKDKDKFQYQKVRFDTVKDSILMSIVLNHMDQFITKIVGLSNWILDILEDSGDNLRAEDYIKQG